MGVEGRSPVRVVVMLREGRIQGVVWVLMAGVWISARLPPL